jgi:hypothetical protein
VAREPIPTWFFALGVVRLGGRFLLVEEREHEGGWYLPASARATRDRVYDLLAAVDGGAPIYLLAVLGREEFRDDD